MLSQESRRILFEPAELLSSRELLSERSDQAEFVMRCGGGGTHWWTKAHIAYVGVVGLLTSNLDDHQLEEGRSGCDKNICICICICICWRDEQNERSTPQSWKKGHKWLAGCDKKIWDIVVTILVEGAAHHHLSPIMCHQKFWSSPSSPLMDVGRRLVGFKDF